MLSMIRSVCVIAVFVLSGSLLWAQDDSANAAPTSGKLVYKSVDSNGQVTFTDSAPKDRPSEAIKVKAANTMPVGVSPTVGDDSAPQQSEKLQVTYKVTITSPIEDELLGQEVESVTLAADLQPGLQEGYTFQLYYDGEPVGGGETSYTVTELYRGTHTVEAKIFDSEKNLVKAAEPLKFHVRRMSVLLPEKAEVDPLSEDTQPDDKDPGGGVGSPKGAGSTKGAGATKASGSAKGSGGAKGF